MSPLAMSTGPDARQEIGRQARLLLRGARGGSLGTLGTGGIPTVTLVTPATAPDLSVLLLLSSLSEHRRNLAEDARCGLMVTGSATSENPQTAPRLSLGGHAFLVPDAEEEFARARWLAAHPYAERYAAFSDFALWRFVPDRAHFVAGFAAAHRLSLENLLPSPAAVAAVAAEEEALRALADAPALARAAGGGPGPWRLTAIDVDGCDLALDERTLRLAFDRTVASPDEVRAELERLVTT